MIIKTKDPKEEELQELLAMLNEEMTPNQRFLIERELKAVKAGVLGEEDSAYYIDFYFGNSKNWAVIHDLRIEHEGQVAQIDHLLINRVFEFYVLESKNYSYGIKITPEGEFQAYYGKHYYGIPSPIEQNKRHIHLLDRFVKAYDILPKRLGMTIRPRFKNVILVSPKSVIMRPPGKKFDATPVIKADTLRTRIDEEVDKITPLADIASFSKLCTPATIEETAKRLASHHRPLRVDFRARFGLPPKTPAESGAAAEIKEEQSKVGSSAKFFCAKCKKGISEKVAKYCWQNKGKFGGKAYCFDCQRTI